MDTTKVRSELIDEQCFRVKQSDLGQELLEINLSCWHGFIEESQLRERARAAPLIALVLDDIGKVESDVLGWISDYVCPRLVELSVISCHDLTWKQLRDMLSACNSLGHLCLRKNHWVTDDVVEQLSIKYAKTLQHLDLEYTKISDNALYQLGKRCLGLKSLHLDCCPRLTSSGLVELSRRIHLSSIHICHNVNIEDAALEQLLAGSSTLSSLRLTNCPKLTDESVNALHESLTAWGKKRNTRAKHLELLEIRDNENITSQALLMLSNASTNIISLDIRDCPAINIADGLESISYLRQLQHLKLGPSSVRNKVKPQARVQSVAHLVKVAPKLLTLGLTGISEFTDEDIAAVLDVALLLEELRVENMKFGTSAVEALCSNVPNVVRLSVIGSAIMRDEDFRCVTTVCLHLEEITVQRCPQLTDGAFSRCAILRRLHLLDITECSPNLVGTLFGCFGLCPLRRLVLDRLNFLRPARDFPRISHKVVLNLNSISLRECAGVDRADVEYVLRSFLNALEVDLSGCPQLARAATFAGIHNAHPFLSPICDGANVGSSKPPPSNISGMNVGTLALKSPSKKGKSRREDAPPELQQLRGFFGFKASARHRIQHQQFAELVHGLRMRSSAKKVAKAYLVHLEHKHKMRGVFQAELQVLKIAMAVKAQAKFRMYRQRKIARRMFAAANVLLRAARMYFVYKAGRQLRRARKFSRRQLMRRFFRWLQRYIVYTHATLVERESRLVPRLQRRMKKRTMAHIKMLDGDVKELTFDRRAEVLWEIHIKEKIIYCWKSVLGITIAKNLKLNKVFLNCVHVNTMNSFRQLADVNRAEIFLHRRLVLPAWAGFCDDYLRAVRANKKMPMAAEHARLGFLNRVVQAAYDGLADYVQYRKWRAQLKWRADVHHRLYYMHVGLSKLSASWSRKNYNRRQYAASIYHRERSNKKEVLATLPFTVKVRRWTAMASEVVDSFWLNFRVRMYWERYKFNIVLIAKLRKMDALAEYTYDKKTIKKFYIGWTKFTRFSRNILQFVRERYQERLKKKAMFGFKLEANAVKAQREKIHNEIMARCKHEDDMLSVLHIAVKMQAHFRGNQVRQVEVDRRITKLFSIRIIQNTVRRGLARMRVRRIRRGHFLSTAKSEERELDEMRRAEQETLYYMYHYIAARNCQRIFRGFRDRDRAALLAIQRTQERGQKFYEQNAHLRSRFEAFQRAEEARRKQKNLLVAKIQARARGMIQRVRYEEMKHMGKVAKYVFACQTWYRGKLARMKLAALRRDKVGEIRFKAARKQRGLLLRMFGFMKRGSQNLLADFLVGAGIDPITFNYRVNELWADVKSDYYSMMDIMRREYGLAEEHRLNRLLMTNARRKILNAAGWTLRVNDSVRIVDEIHQFYGYTGVVVRIDSDVPGLPLYEIKLDHFDKRQTFAMMTTDALVAYDRQQVLANIKKFPELIDFEQPYVVFGIDPEDPLYTEKSVNAVWTIQRAFRCYRARNIVARKRYEAWTRTAHCQRALFSQLADLNAVTAQAYHISGFLGLKFNRRVFFDALRHPAIPIRLLTNATSAVEETNIRDEFNVKYGQRVHYLERCAITKDRDPFWLGYERMTTMRKMGIARRVIWGFIRNSGSSIKDLVGRKGAKFLSKQKSMVTGVDNYRFPDLQGSPHVRYPKTIMYQGEWSGIPLFTPLAPHGEGLIVFLDGWGFAREDKVLYLTVVRCTRLMAMDLVSSDPYVDVFCNAKNLQTSVKYSELNPAWHESFEIDVTNPSAKVKLVVKDKDFLTSDDFMGQVELNLSDYADGKERRQTFTLCDEFMMLEDDNDRGDIELVVRWADRVFTDDMQRAARELSSTIRIQAFVRRIFARLVLRKLGEERKVLLTMVHKKCVLINCCCRRRLAYKVFKKMSRRVRATIKLQKRVRVYLARKQVKWRRRRHLHAIVIQTFGRSIIAKNTLAKKRQDRINMFNHAATLMQAGGRRLIARCREYVRRLAAKQEAAQLAIQTGVKPERVHVSDWFDTYGRDAVYGLKRTRRTYENTFARMLTLKYCRLATRFGDVFVDRHPPPELDKVDGEDLRENEEVFVAVFVPMVQGRLVHREQAIEAILKTPHNAVLHLTEAVSTIKSVDQMVVQIQCALRTFFALKAYKMRLKVKHAVIMLQRGFRRRFEKLHRASQIISACLRAKQAKKRTIRQRVEVTSARKMQSCVRIWIAKCRLFDRRCIRRVEVLRANSEVKLHEANKVLDFKSNSFWLADSTEVAECRFELKRRQAVEEIWVMTCTRQASPQTVTIEVVQDKRTMKYEMLYSEVKLEQLNGYQWRRFTFRATVVKFFKLTFRFNYGDEEHIGVRQIRFVKAKEKSATIVRQPDHFIFKDNGPVVGMSMRCVLKVDADGWPLCTYQWYRNGHKVPGATKAELILNLRCELAEGFRTYRCMKCKMVCLEVPENCYHIVCGNCSHHFNYKESELYDNIVLEVHEAEAVERKELEAYCTSRDEMLTSKDPKLRAMIASLEEKILETEGKLQLLKERRNTIKEGLEFANIFSDEGLYICVVENLRGGELVMKKKTRPAVVFVEQSERYRVKVRPQYNRRMPVIRKKWTIYSSISGTFINGKLSGLVLIRYIDNSFYEGPYIGEEWLDSMGLVNDDGRAENHYGVYTLFDGRVFEGKQIDNHFDPNNLQSFYRCTLPNGEMYEGMFTDEMYHGVGMYSYADGSVYEGNFHKNMRFGHGHFRSSKADGAWSYEGEWDTNRKHGEGTITWADGSFYIGDWYYENRKGRGVFISRLRDVYRGEFDDNLFHGHGEMIYSDGSRYIGGFSRGKRSGRGILSTKKGGEFYGHFRDDLLHGEVIVKNIIPIETLEQDNFEVRVALYQDGEFKEWKSKYSNPMATRQFVKLFKENREMFDSVYSMIVAKSLPDIPHGLDDRNEDVSLILDKIRTEAGLLVGQEVLEKAHARLQSLLAPMKEVKEFVIALKDELDALSVQTVNNEQAKAEMLRDYRHLMTEVERDTLKIEQYWYDDPTESRRHFQEASKLLSGISKDDYFFFKNHRNPPPFVRKVLDAICILLGRDINVWKQQQMVVSDAVFNARFQDDDALRYDYHCKLDFMVNSKHSNFDIFDYVTVFDSKHFEHLQNILTDPRFRVDSYYVESCGSAAPTLVEWVGCMYRYVKCARNVYAMLEQARKNKVLASRLANDRKRKEDEQLLIMERIKKAREEYQEKLLEQRDLEEAIMKAEDMIQFVEDSYNFGKKRTLILDYYEVLEKKLEQQKDQLDIASCVEAMIGVCEGREAETRREKMKECRARGEVYVPTTVQVPQLRDMITEEVTFQQNALISDNQWIGYSVDVKENPVSPELTKNLVGEMVQMIVGSMNTCFHEQVHCRRWAMLSGRVLKPRFLYCMVWERWKGIAVEREENAATAAWEDIFGPDKINCARMAIQAKVNWRMSEVAKWQSQIWVKSNKLAMEQAETQISAEFAEEHPKDTAEEALLVSEDESGVNGPEPKAGALCWIKLHPETFGAVKDERADRMAKDFASSFPTNTGMMAFKVLNGLLPGGAPEYAKYDQAEQWVNYNREQYDADVAVVSLNLAKKFQEKFPLKTAMNAVQVIHREDTSKYITDEEAHKEYSQAPDEYFSARCWGLLNQGLLRGSSEIYAKEQKTLVHRLWGELEHNSEGFLKGSYLHTAASLKYNPTHDRFAGFRDRLASKYAYVLGYLSKRAYDLFNAMEGFKHADPLTKVVHNVRPSKSNQIEATQVDQFLTQMHKYEDEYADVMSKLNMWNTYFGSEEEKEWYASNADPNA